MSGAGLNIVLLCGTWAGPSPGPRQTLGHTHGVAVNTCATRDAGKSSLMVSSAAALRLPPGQLLAPKGHPSCPRAPGLSFSPWHMALPPPQLSPPTPCSLSPLCPRLWASVRLWLGPQHLTGPSPGPPSTDSFSPCPRAPQPPPPRPDPRAWNLLSSSILANPQPDLTAPH